MNGWNTSKARFDPLLRLANRKYCHWRYQYLNMCLVENTWPLGFGLDRDWVLPETRVFWRQNGAIGLMHCLTKILCCKNFPKINLKKITHKKKLLILITFIVLNSRSNLYSICFIIIENVFDALTPKDENRLTRRLENVCHHKQFAQLFPNFPFWKFGIWCRQNRSRIAYSRCFVFLKRWGFCRLTLWLFSLAIWKTCHNNAPFLRKHSVWKSHKNVSSEFLRGNSNHFNFRAKNPE